MRTRHGDISHMYVPTFNFVDEKIGVGKVISVKRGSVDSHIRTVRGIRTVVHVVSRKCKKGVYSRDFLFFSDLGSRGDIMISLPKSLY